METYMIIGITAIAILIIGMVWFIIDKPGESLELWHDDPFKDSEDK